MEAPQPVCPASRIRIHWTCSQKVRGLNEKKCLQLYNSPTDDNTDALQVGTFSITSVLSPQLAALWEVLLLCVKWKPALSTRQCALSNVPLLDFGVPKGFFHLKFIAECRVCDDCWREHCASLGCRCFIHMHFFEPGTTIGRYILWNNY